MKARLFAVLCFVIPFSATAAPATAPSVVKGPHYTVTSWAGPEAGQATLAVMEALVVRYNSLFLFDLSQAPAPWNVTLYATKADFDAALVGQVSAPASDYLYLHYADPTRSQLAAWVPDEGSPIDEVRSLAFQGFFQFLWTFLPHPPAWIETGLASVFWNSQWDGKTLTADPDTPHLDALQARWKDKTPDLKALLEAPEGTLTAASGRDLEAWALTAYLLETPDPTYARLFGTALANLSPSATEVANRTAVVQRFQAAKDWETASADLKAWWMAKVSFSSRITRGTAQFKDKDFEGAKASFQAALVLRPHDAAALYYAGLTAYGAKDYPAAEEYFARVPAPALPKGLLAYARGLNAFARKQNDAAKTWLSQAKTEDEAAYGKLVAPVLDLIP